MLWPRIFLLLLFFNPPLFAEEEKIEVRTIGISPYGIDNNGQLSGAYYDLANQLFGSKVNINHAIYPYARIIHELQTGQTDLTIMFKYDELENYVTYIAPLPPLQNVIVALSGEHFKSITELEGESIAYLRGANFSKAIENNDAITLYRTKNFTKSIEMLKAERVAAVIGPFEALVMAAKNLGDSVEMFGTPLVVSERTPWLQISNKSKNKFDVTKLREQFINSLENNKLEALKNKYLKQIN